MPGLTPRGQKMPQTIEEWCYLGNLYEKALLESDKEIGRLKAKINRLEQKLAATNMRTE